MVRGGWSTRHDAELYEWLRPGELPADPPRTWAAERHAASTDHLGPTAARGAEGLDDGGAPP